jgi:hypothetical protein
LFAIEPHRDDLQLSDVRMQTVSSDERPEENPMLTDTLPVEGFTITSETSQGLLVVQAYLGRQALKHVVQADEKLYFSAILAPEGDPYSTSIEPIATVYTPLEAHVHIGPGYARSSKTAVALGVSAAESRLTVNIKSAYPLGLAKLPMSAHSDTDPGVAARA